MPIATSIIEEIKNQCQLEILDANFSLSQLLKEPQYQTVHTNDAKYFLKTAPRRKPDICITEANALNEIKKHTNVRIPDVICTGQNRQYSFILLEHLNLQNSALQQSHAKVLIELHSVWENQFGWHHTNYIGRSTQNNEQSESWLDFWLNQRIAPQIEMAKMNNASQRLLHECHNLRAISRELLLDHQPKPVLLHGDFWSGNIATLANGEAVTFDPAIYYGDRETDIAMTELFGGFSESFYATYERRLPLADEYQIRKHLYNCYHLLNHVNIFGEQPYGSSFSRLYTQLSSYL